jgi:UTP15 C terminal
MVEELSYRNGLDIAIDNLPEKSLLEMLGFIYKKCDSAEHQKILFILFDMILNRLNKISPVGQSTKVDNMLADIQDKLFLEAQTAKETVELGGILELIESQI